MSFTVTNKTIEQLEFDKIIELVSAYCKGSTAVDILKDRPFCEGIEEVRESLSEVNDFVKLKSNGHDISFREYFDLSDILTLLSKEGYVLESEAAVTIGQVLQNYRAFELVMSSSEVEDYPSLFRAGHLVNHSTEPLESIERVFDEQGEVKQDASPDLVKIFKKTETAKRKSNSVFDQIVGKYKDKQVLAETPESWRNGRRVLVVPAEYKRRITGVIHDQSSSGKTFFIEPQEIIQINNDLFSLENEKRTEIYRILKALSKTLRSHLHLIRDIEEKVTAIDIIRAKAVFALLIKAVQPEISKDPQLNLHGVRHPLLVVKENEGGDKVIPFDLELKGQNRLLLISGPNAGGKSVTLKAVGLCHLMTYAGMLISVEEQTEIGLFDEVFTDIGDQQSIDDGLSTYSSHLTNLNDIIQHCGRRSLVLLDEIGSGTDPKLGGAIAEGILKSLIERKANGVITTHYSALKVFAFKNKGILNGAMLFDKTNLTPTYKLKVGKPGSSYAFEVANKIGMDEKIIRYARKKVGSKENAVEDLLINLQQQKARLDVQLERVVQEKERLDRLIGNYETLSTEFKVKRKKLQIRAKELEAKKANDENLQLQILIKELQKERNLEAAEAARKAAIQKRSQEAQEIKILKKEVYEGQRLEKPLKKGDFVRLLDGDMSGEVIEVKKDKAKVLFGLLRMDVPLSDLIHARDQIEINREKGINLKGIAFDQNFSPRLDIRGYKLEDADRTLQEFFDRALMNNANTLEVVHGKGSGALRKLVQRKMREYKDIESSWHPAEELGGEGVTMIRL